METTMEAEEWAGIPGEIQIAETVLRAMAAPAPPHQRPSRHLNNHSLLAPRAEVWGWCCPAEGTVRAVLLPCPSCFSALPLPWGALKTSDGGVQTRLSTLPPSVPLAGFQRGGWLVHVTCGIRTIGLVPPHPVCPPMGSTLVLSGCPECPCPPCAMTMAPFPEGPSHLCPPSPSFVLLP